MSDYEKVARAIRFLDGRFAEQPSLEELAALAGLSPWHFQRVFSRWAGVSPKAFLQSQTQANARRRLSEGASVLDAALDSGLSGPGRLHDLSLRMEAATPGEIKSGGAGWTISYGVAETPFGDALIGLGPRGICQLSFVEQGGGETEIRAEIERRWPAASLERSDRVAVEVAETVFRAGPVGESLPSLSLYVSGTAFQVRVWRALLEVREGEVTTYKRLAQRIGQRTAARAVGNAVGANPIAYLIPCHRVIRETGAFGGYRWGSERKRALLGREMARAEGCRNTASVTKRA